MAVESVSLLSLFFLVFLQLMCLRRFYKTLLVGDVKELIDTPSLSKYFPDGKDGGMVGVGLGDEALLLRR